MRSGRCVFPGVLLAAGLAASAPAGAVTVGGNWSDSTATRAKGVSGSYFGAGYGWAWDTQASSAPPLGLFMIRGGMRATPQLDLGLEARFGRQEFTGQALFFPVQATVKLTEVCATVTLHDSASGPFATFGAGAAFVAGDVNLGILRVQSQTTGVVLLADLGVRVRCTRVLSLRAAGDLNYLLLDGDTSQLYGLQVGLEIHP